MVKAVFQVGKVGGNRSVGIQKQVVYNSGDQDHDRKHKFAAGPGVPFPFSKILNQRCKHENTAHHIAQACVENQRPSGDFSRKESEIRHKAHHGQHAVHA